MRTMLIITIILLASASASACGDDLLSSEIEAAGFFCPCAVAQGAVFMTPTGPGQEVVCTTPLETRGYPVSGSVTYWIITTPDKRNHVMLPDTRGLGD